MQYNEITIVLKYAIKDSRRNQTHIMVADEIIRLTDHRHLPEVSKANKEQNFYCMCSRTTTESVLPTFTFGELVFRLPLMREGYGGACG